ncbi:MAG: hypothetical protein M3H12_18730 [Chromatiales bacterium]|nr:hypothetical protein [Gammaproteobacteria bacterium]
MNRGTLEALILAAAMIIAADMVNIEVTVNVTDKPIFTTTTRSVDNVVRP